MVDTLEFPAGAAIVVGGSGGVGRAIVDRIARAGSDVVVTYRRNADAAEAAGEVVRSYGRSAEVMRVSLEDESEVASMIERAITKFGGIHTVVDAAGADIPMRFIGEIDQATWRTVIDGDVHGFFVLVRASLPHLRKAKGSIVAITSAGLRRYPTRDVLSVAPKAAIEAIVRAVACEEGRYGVRANSVALGVIDAGIFHRLKETELADEWLEAAKKNTPLHRFGTAEEVAEVVAFLASSRASYVTGQSLAVDGGYSA